GVGAVVVVDADHVVRSARLAFVSVAATPLVLDVSDTLAGAARDVDLSAVREPVLDVIDPDGDIHATAEYRRHLAGVLAVRAVREARDRAVAA
ncbi:MAG: xanthine dehydrogenase family protein subunit M, partial [Actinobacteria bacterium]|nr:xanthine dehydrogenase family protein subunit M [Actinomycetota bacterium]